MPLTFTDGLLPPGIHAATLDEVEAELARSSRRTLPFENLKRYVADVRLTGWDCRLIIDGSFVTPAVDDPNDIDAILVMPDGWDFTLRAFRPFEYNVLDIRRTKSAFKIEVFPVARGSNDERKLLHLFSGVREEWCLKFGWPVDIQKGLVEIVP